MLSFVTRSGGPGGIEACPQEHYFLQCFDTVGWVILPAKTVPEMTYNVFSGTLNPTHSLAHLGCTLACKFKPDWRRECKSIQSSKFSQSCSILAVTLYIDQGDIWHGRAHR